MELEEEAAERAYLLWQQNPYAPFPYAEIPPDLPMVEYRWDSKEDWEEPWGRWDTTSIYELRTRVFSICEEQGFVVTEAQFEVAAALVDEWEGSLADLLDLARITVPDPDGRPFSG